MLWALVPAKLGPAVKTRLGAVLSPDQRLALARAMLCDVFTVLTSSPSLGGLNEGVAQGIAALRARGASGVLVVMGDLPNLTAADVAQTIAALPERGVVLVPSRDGTGTNMLAARPADVLPATSFGPGSLALHRAATVSLPTVLLPLRGAALDVDTVDDLEMLLRGGAAGEATRDALADLTPPRPPERIG
jgi:2-phospho-L-lactate guanylyltransferase